MIVTVTPNPSVDRILCVDRLTRGDVLRSGTSWSEPSGKGVNVALALRAHGSDSHAVFPAGGVEGARLQSLLQATGLEFTAVPIGGEIRSNINIIEPDGTTTKVNEPGPVIEEGELKALIDAAAVPAEWLVGCGSLPVEAPVSFYADLVRAGRRTSAHVAVDTSGPALAATLPAGPDLIKPNAAELAEAAGQSITTLGDAVRAAQRLRDLGAGTVLASLGADGALLVSENETIHGEVRVANPRSTAGAGDALLAGFLSAGATGDKALATALAWAAAAVRQPGTVLTANAAIDPARVVLHGRIDHPRPLRP